MDGTYILEVYKDDKKGDTKATIVMDLCDKVVRVNILNNLINNNQHIMSYLIIFLLYNVFKFLE